MSPTSDVSTAVVAAMLVTGTAVVAIAGAPATVALVAGEGGLFALLLAGCALIAAPIGAWRRSAFVLVTLFPLLALGALLATPRIALAAIATPSGALSLSLAVIAWTLAALAFTTRVADDVEAPRPIGGQQRAPASFGTPGHRLALAMSLVVPGAALAWWSSTRFFVGTADATMVFVVATWLFGGSIVVWIAGVGPSVGGAWDDVLMEHGMRNLGSRRSARIELVVAIGALVAAAAAAVALHAVLRAG